MNETRKDPHSIPEQSARFTARGDYSRWLAERFQHLDLLHMVDDMDPISLRRIFVPLQVAEEEGREEGRLNDEERQGKLPGKALWDVMEREPALLLSGKPGCGKSTLVQAIVVDLVSEISELRKRIARPPGIFPLPIILRNYPVETIQNLEELLDLWWEDAAKQAKADNRPLDIERLKFSIDPKGDAFPVILLLDGIDETGSQKNRQKIVDFAFEAQKRGWRVLLTGRPDGFTGLRLTAEKDKKDSNIQEKFLKPFHVLPFAWSQIERFIRDWYKLRSDWEREKEQGIKRFLDALQDSRRPYLMSLARRPIFLTLMAHVHCTDRQMPEGRAELYTRIVTLYLIRQDKYRELKQTISGATMPHWSEAEKRMVLGYLAWQSQGRIKEGKEGSRQVVWKKKYMIDAIKNQLATGEHGRFTTMKPKNAEAILQYFLWPAGLLVEPAEDSIQFAHLSFQEYLCADFLYNRGKVKGLQNYLKSELFDKLDKPGWLEVASLLLAIHAEETSDEGHFQMLSWLDPSDRLQAKLLVQSICSGELPFTEKEQENWLPLAMACVLIHPMDYIEPLPFEGLSNKVREKGREILINIFGQPEEIWKTLQNNYAGYEAEAWVKAESRWQNPPVEDDSWFVLDGPEEARIQGMILLAAALGEGGDDPLPEQKVENEEIWKLAPHGKLAKAMANWLNKRMPKEKWKSRNSLFWKEEARGLEKEDKQLLLFPTLSASMVNMTSPASGELWQTLMNDMPPAFFLLQGEEFWEDFVFDLWWYLDSIFLSFYPKELELPPRLILSLILYQTSALAEALAMEGLSGFSEKKSQSQSLLQSQSLSRSQSLSLSLSLSRSRSRSRSLSLSLSRSRSRSRSRLRLRSQSRSLSRLLSRSLSLSLSLSLSRSLSRSRSLSLLKSLSNKDNLFSINLKEIQKNADLLLARNDLSNSMEERLYRAISSLGFQVYALDWFSEQVENPKLMEQRGMKPGEPLPRNLGFFDEKGFPLAKQRRESWKKLQAWLENDETVIDFCFEGKELSNLDREILLDDLKQLRRYSWSPHEAVRIALESWPKNKNGSYETFDFSPDAFVKAVEKVVDEITQELARKKQEKP